MAPSPYPARSEIQSIFAALATGDGPAFFAHVIDDVDWRVMGHSPMSTSYTNKEEFQEKTMKYLNAHVLKEPLTMQIVDVTGGGDDESAAIEMKADSICRNGLKYDMVYCWIVKFNQDRKIKSVRAYVDTELLTRAIEQNK